MCRVIIVKSIVSVISRKKYNENAVTPPKKYSKVTYNKKCLDPIYI